MAKLIATVETLDETTVHQTPGEGEWSAIETLAHVAESVPFWAQRARQIANGTLGDQPFERTPEESAQRTAAIAEHGRDSLAAMVRRLQSSATDSAAILREIPDQSWGKTAHYEPGSTNQTVSEIVTQRIVRHVQAHTRQAAQAARGDQSV
jgi:uncharacterized damage-inducible protein DinB